MALAIEVQFSGLLLLILCGKQAKICGKHEFFLIFNSQPFKKFREDIYFLPHKNSCKPYVHFSFTRIVLRMEELFEYLQSLYPLSPEIQAALVTRFTKETHRKNKLILREGELCNWMAFIEKGMVKICYDIPGGDERVISFHREGEVACSIKSYTNHLPSKVSIVSCDDTIIRKIRKIELESICERHPIFNVHLLKILEAQSILLEDHYILMTIPARDRLKKLESEFSWILEDKRIKDYMIASFLGIDRATLSRFRKRSTGE